MLALALVEVLSPCNITLTTQSAAIGGGIMSKTS